LRENPTLRKI